MEQGRRAGPGLALFLDFDGTLVDIAPTPDSVVVEPGLSESLARIRDALGGALAIVTGRPVSGVDQFLPRLNLDACGLHGLERRVGGRLVDTEPLPDLGPEIRAVRERLAGWPGIVVEDKKVGVAVHWRLAPEAEDPATRAIDDLARRLGSAYRIQEGKAVREIVPVAAGKGAGIEALMRLPPYEGRHPVFVGDDRTDEDGFRAVNELGGSSIKIGTGPTRARFRIATPGRFRAMLRTWAERGPDLSPLDPA